MATEDNKIWVNTLMDKEDVKKLDEMVKDNGSTRAAFIRLLIDREYEERKRNEIGKKNLLKKLETSRKNTTPNYRTKDLSPT